MEELKTLPKILEKYSKVIKKVEHCKRDPEDEKREYGYVVTLDKEYTIDGKPQTTIKATTAKAVRKIIRSNRLLTVDQPKKAKKETK